MLHNCRVRLPLVTCRDVRVIRYFFWLYVGVSVLTLAVLVASPALTRARDPGTLYCSFASAIQTLDPLIVSDAMTGEIIGDVYETLYFPPYGEQGDGLVPVLAADFPKISSDNLIYTIPIRHGVRFYDPSHEIWPDGKGRELTADDVVYSFQRLADFRVASDYYSTVLEGRIQGVDAFRQWSSFAGGPAGSGYADHPISGIKALDDHTLQITLTKPYPLLEYLLGEEPIICPEAFEHFGTLGEHAVGTGPYGLAEYQVGQRVILRANPFYRGRPDGEGPGRPADRIPSIQRVQYDYMAESLPAWHLFLQGRYDVSTVPKETFSNVMDDKMKLRPEFAARSICSELTIKSHVQFLKFNYKDPLLGSSVDLRRAFSLAIDRDTFVRVYLSNIGLPATSFLPSCSPTHDPAYRGPWNRYDPQAARALVRKVEGAIGHPLPSFKILFPDTDSETRQSAEFLIKEFEDVGIHAEPDYATQAHAIERVDSRNFQIYFWGWNAGPDDYTYFMLFDKNQIPPPNFNDGSYFNPRFQGLFDQISVMRRSAERDRMYREMTAILDDDLPAAAVYYRSELRLRYARVGNYRNSPLNSPPKAFLTLRPGRVSP